MGDLKAGCTYDGRMYRRSAFSEKRHVLLDVPRSSNEKKIILTSPNRFDGKSCCFLLDDSREDARGEFLRCYP